MYSSGRLIQPGTVVSAVTRHVCRRDISVALPRWAASQPGSGSHVIATVAVSEGPHPAAFQPVSGVARRLSRLGPQREVVGAALQPQGRCACAWRGGRVPSVNS